MRDLAFSFQLPTSVVRFATAGSVDDGKSTFIGRLLYDTDSLFTDHIAALQSKSSKSGGGKLSLALVTDGLKAEREQGITIDVAYRYFSTPKRRFILADAPGHETYTRNMATAASKANAMTILVDAKNGISIQTRRHAVIGSLLGVPRLVVAVNKMDLVDFSQSRFDELVEEFSQFASKLNIRDVRFIPVCAMDGDNIVHPSKRMPWYGRETILDYLENVYLAADENLVDIRFPVQIVLRLPDGKRGYAGSLVSGRLRVGDEIVILPSGQRSNIRKILPASVAETAREIEEAHPHDPVVLILDSEVDVARGDIITRPQNVPRAVNKTEAMLVWFGDAPLITGTQYILRHLTRETRVEVTSLHYRLDVSNLKRTAVIELNKNDIGRASITTSQPLLVDAYHRNRESGSFILIDSTTFDTVAAGMFLERDVISDSTATDSSHIHFEHSLVGKRERAHKWQTPPVTAWLTGYSGSGKSTIARVAEELLIEKGMVVVWLDGDTLRHGLSSDLTFTPEDRRENVRRAAEVAKILNDRGIAVICSFVTPFANDREYARSIVGTDAFIEVFVDTPLSVCEQRDPHGLYEKARQGTIKGFTGVSAPYEPPVRPDIVIPTHDLTVEQCAELLVRSILSKKEL